MPLGLYHCTNCGAEGNYVTTLREANAELCRECNQPTLQRIYAGQTPTIRTSDKTQNSHGPRMQVTMAAFIAHGL